MAKFKLTLLVAALTAAVSAAVSAAKHTAKLYHYGADLIKAAEAAYDGVEKAGASKKEAVMAAVKALADQLSLDWPDIEAEYSAWIDSVVEAYNDARALSD